MNRSLPHDGGSTKGNGLLLGLIAVAIFALTLPATRVATQSLDPWFVGFSRSAVAGMIAVALLLYTRSPLPDRRQLIQLALITIGVVFGFPLCTALGMETIPASHGGIMLGILPLITALFGSYLNKEQNGLVFWLCSIGASAVVIAFAANGNLQGWQAGDTWLIAAVLFAGWGYALSGRLSSDMEGWRVICWALVLSLPISLPTTVWLKPEVLSNTTTETWIALLYLALFSQLLGFFAWNKAMAIGGVGRIGQIQLLQPFMTLVASWLLIDEAMEAKTLIYVALVILLVGFGTKSRALSTKNPSQTLNGASNVR